MKHIEKYELTKVALDYKNYGVRSPIYNKPSQGKRLLEAGLKGGAGGALLGAAGGGIVGLIRKLMGSDSSLLSNIGGGALLGSGVGAGVGIHNSSQPQFYSGVKDKLS